MKTLGALPQHPRKTLGRCPKPCQGARPLEPIMQERFSLPRGTKINILVKIPLSKRELVSLTSQAVVLFYSKSASANACICVCPNGVKGRNSLCGSLRAAPSRSCRGYWGQSPQSLKYFGKRPLAKGKLRIPIHKRFSYFTPNLHPQTHAYAFALTGSRGGTPFAGV